MPRVERLGVRAGHTTIQAPTTDHRPPTVLWAQNPLSTRDSQTSRAVQERHRASTQSAGISSRPTPTGAVGPVAAGLGCEAVTIPLGRRARDRTCADGDDHRRELRRLPDPLHLLRLRAGHRLPGQEPGLGVAGLLPVRALAARVGHGPGVHLRQPRRRRDHGDVGQRRRLRHRDGALLLDRRHPGDAVPRCRDDAVLLRLQGAVGAGVHAPAFRSRRPPRQRDLLRRGSVAHRGHQPVPA